MRIKTLQLLERILGAIIPVLESWREKVAVCPDCGRNRYTGEPCISFPVIK